MLEEGTRKIKCGADKRRRRGLDRAEHLSAQSADANESLSAYHETGYPIWDNPFHIYVEERDSNNQMRRG